MRSIVTTILFSLFLCSTAVKAQSIDWVSLSEAQRLAAENQKKVMIFAEADWCGYCRKMNKNVFPEQAVRDSLSKYFYPVRLDIESDKKVTFNGKTYTQKDLSRTFRVTSTPLTIFVDAGGNIIGTQPGYLPPNIFDKLLAFVGAELTGTMPFKKYLKKHGVTVGK